MKKELGGNLLKLVFFSLCIYGIVRLSIWSYFQTQMFFEPFDGDNGNKIISNAMALLFQYGQNVSLFLAAIEQGRQLAYRNKIESIKGNTTHINILEEEIGKSQTLSGIFYALFGVFALIDAGTNVGQFLETTYTSATQTFSGSTTGLYIFMAVGLTVSLAVVFVEELFMKTANAVLHALNDVLESLGIRRISSLDLFVDPDKVLATRLEERGGRGTQNQKPAGTTLQGQGQFKKQSPSLQYNLQKPNRQTQQPRPSQTSRNPQPQMRLQSMRDVFEDDDGDETATPPFSRAEPTYHPIGMNAQGDMRKRFDA